MISKLRGAGLLAIVTAALAACSGEPEDSADTGDTGKPAMDIAEAAREFDKLEKPRPGQYDMDVEIVSFDMPGAPEGILDQMRGAMESAYADGFCLTQEEADKGFEEQLGQIAQDGQCDFSEMAVDDGAINARALCQLDGGTMEMTMNGTVSATGSDITAQSTLDAQGQTMAMTVRMKQTRTGDCAA